MASPSLHGSVGICTGLVKSTSLPMEKEDHNDRQQLVGTSTTTDSTTNHVICSMTSQLPLLPTQPACFLSRTRSFPCGKTHATDGGGSCIRSTTLPIALAGCSSRRPSSTSSSNINRNNNITMRWRQSWTGGDSDKVSPSNPTTTMAGVRASLLWKEDEEAVPCC